MAQQDEDTKLLTVYPQRKWHHNAYVVGNRKGLQELRDAIDAALAGPEHEISVGLAVVEPTDCETYYVAVVCDGHENDDVDTAYWDPEVEDRSRGNSLVPNERYIMAVGVAADVKRRQYEAERQREIDESRST